MVGGTAAGPAVLRKPDLLSYHIAMLQLARDGKVKECNLLYDAVTPALCPRWFERTDGSKNSKKQAKEPLHKTLSTDIAVSRKKDGIGMHWHLVQ